MRPAATSYARGACQLDHDLCTRWGSTSFRIGDIPGAAQLAIRLWSSSVIVMDYLVSRGFPLFIRISRIATQPALPVDRYGGSMCQ